MFGYESHVHKSEINGDMVPTGTLITTFQKGLQYLELEANLAAEVSVSGSDSLQYQVDSQVLQGYSMPAAHEVGGQPTSRFRTPSFYIDMFESSQDCQMGLQLL